MFNQSTRWAVFDLDGCLAQAPYADERVKRDLPDADFWHRHWTSGPATHQENLHLLNALRIACWNVVILTGRPDSHHTDTTEWLDRAGVRVFDVDDIELHADTFNVVGGAYLKMRPTVKGMNIANAAPWKLWQIEEWQQRGMQIQFALEDHKPTADVIRRAVPVLLYERQRL